MTAAAEARATNISCSRPSQPERTQSKPLEEGYKYHFFLSYNGNEEDKKVVRVVQEKLGGLGYKSFRDETKILGGESIPGKVAQGISDSKVMVFFLSKVSIHDGKWLIAEQAYSVRSHHQVFVWVDVIKEDVANDGYWGFSTDKKALKLSDKNFYKDLEDSLNVPPPPVLQRKSSVEQNKDTRFKDLQRKLDRNHCELELLHKVIKINAGRYFGWYDVKNCLSDKLRSKMSQLEEPLVFDYYHYEVPSLNEGFQLCLAKKLQTNKRLENPPPPYKYAQGLVQSIINDTREKMAYECPGIDKTIICNCTTGLPLIVFVLVPAGINLNSLGRFKEELKGFKSRPRLVVLMQVLRDKSPWNIISRVSSLFNKRDEHKLPVLEPLRNCDSTSYIEANNFSKVLLEFLNNEMNLEHQEDIKEWFVEKITKICTDILEECKSEISMKDWKVKFQQRVGKEISDLEKEESDILKKLEQSVT